MIALSTKITGVVLSVILFSVVFVSTAYATATGKVSISPARVDVALNPGAKITKNITVTNSLSIPAVISISSEDIIGSNDVNNPVILMGSEASSWTLKNYLSSNTKSFELSSGESRVVPITVTLPAEVSKAGLYGAVVFSIRTKEAGNEINTSGATVRSRLASLFFVRTTGERTEEGKLLNFDTRDGKYFIFGSPVEFESTYQNTGTVHLNPYGILTIKNIFGSDIYMGAVPPTFVLPNSKRSINPVWDSEWWRLGKYSARLDINRGYGDIVDTFSTSIFIMSIPMMILVIIFIVILYFVSRQLIMNKRLYKTNA